MGLSSTLIYTSELILCSIICDQELIANFIIWSHPDKQRTKITSISLTVQKLWFPTVLLYRRLKGEYPACEIEIPTNTRRFAANQNRKSRNIRTEDPDLLICLNHNSKNSSSFITPWKWLIRSMFRTSFSEGIFKKSTSFMVLVGMCLALSSASCFDSLTSSNFVPKPHRLPSLFSGFPVAVAVPVVFA